MINKLFDQFEDLRASMLNFCRGLDIDSRNAWIANWHTNERSIEMEQILFDLWYHEDQDGRETRLYPGLIGLTREQITYANEINLHKDKFRSTVQAIKDQDNLMWRDVQGSLAKRFQPLNEALSREGLSRLHLKQVFRHLPLVVTRPDKVGFSWYSSGRSINKISKTEAYELLLKLNTESQHIRIQLDRLANLPDSEPLARVQKQAPVLRANLVFADKKRRSMNVSLPLFFPQSGKATLPEFNIPPISPPTARSRLIRSDNKIIDEAFLPSIRVHRYSSKTKTTFY